MNDTAEKTPEEVESEVWVAISAFEQILEAMPNDRASLDALAHAYEQIGDLTRAKDYLGRFAQVLLDEKDAAACEELLPKLEKFAEMDPALADKVVRIGSLLKESQEAAAVAPQKSDEPPPVLSGSPGSGFKMSDEMSFAWNLSEAHQITEEEYSGIVQDLTEMSSAAATTTVSVLHVMEHRAFKNLDKIVAFVSEECGTPFLSLQSFSVRKAAFAKLPRDFMVRRGVLIFDFLGQDALAVILNPYNTALRKEVESMAGQTCHFFMTLPSEFDQTLGRADEIMAQDED